MPNRLISEQSPYLLQHAHNPVNWYPWGDEAFEAAKTANKPVIVSIGYAACHWCHVMERESFEDAATAAYMNEHFVCIKVDREEHPDVDHLYMDAVQAISGSGGWPLNVFVTPGRIPFYGGTYFPPRPAYSRPSWLQVMQRMHEVWVEQQDEVQAQADQMVRHLRQASQVASAVPGATWTAEDCRKIADALLQMADKEQGGFGRAPKFPGTMAISYLLEHYHFTKYEPALEHALGSLDAMIGGGIYDQLAGGFARYATDDNWLIPHFEKMLYDNALLVLSMCDAYRITRKPHYAGVIRDTITFVNRELANGAGGFYSALDADSEGVEGKFYTWTWDEWLEALGENDAVAAAYWGVTEEGNWEETNILHVPAGAEKVAAAFGIDTATVMQRVESARLKLLAKRSSRVRPLTDDKSLLSWNALMNMALTAAGAALDAEEYRLQAAAHMSWILESFAPEDKLMHTWKAGAARISANLDDYAYLVQALIRLASSAGDHSWLIHAKKWMEYTIAHFSAEQQDFFFYTGDFQQDIPVRKLETYDGATPSSNAVMAHNLFALGLCLENREWQERAWIMLQKMTGTIIRYPYSFGYWTVQLQRYANELKTIVCTGNDAVRNLRVLEKEFIPESLLLAAQKEIFEIPLLNDVYFQEENYIFVCTQNFCLPPANDPDAALSLLDGQKGKKV
ncbi:thioredoxin domain-containing protein [Chitinophagaceae bacterium MMS25-I14]